MGYRSQLDLEGPYDSWDKARGASDGWESGAILEAVTASAAKVIRGEAPYERDGVCFDEVQHHWALLASLQRVLLAAGKLEVLDFGGGMGTTYNYVRPLLPGHWRWSIVEQPAFAEAARAAWGVRDGPRFFDNVRDCLATGTPNLALLSGVLQCLEDPWAIAGELTTAGIEWVIVDRTPMADAPTRAFVQVVPPSIYPARLPTWVFNERELLDAFREYERVYEFSSPFDPQIPPHKGFLLRRRDSRTPPIAR